MSVELLRETLIERERAFNADRWNAGLDERKRGEAEFHDEWRDPELVAVHEATQTNSKYYAIRGTSEAHTDRWIRENARGSVFLDYCCGEGKKTVEAARSGARLAIGIDLSPTSIDLGRRRAKAAGVSSNTQFIVGDSEDTGLPTNSIDRVLAYGVLHHLDLTRAFPEIQRLLAPSGRLYAMEPLIYNPVLQIYRRMTPKLRTEWEKNHILSLETLRLARHFFAVENVRYWHILGVLAAPFRRTPLWRPALAVGNAVDAILQRTPGVQLMAWSFSFELVKKG